MTFKKCDGCKKTYERTAHECGTLLMSVYDSCHPSWPDGIRFDFCPKCMRKVEDLITKEMKI